MKPEIILPPYIRKTLDLLASENHQAYLVGGCVRDYFLGLTPHDYDIATDATAEEVEAICKKKGRPFYKRINKNFTTALLIYGKNETVEVTSFTAPKIEEPVPKDIREDLIARDFTINTMAIDHEGNLVDCFNGLSDLENGILKTPTDPSITLTHDPLRMLRYYRFLKLPNMKPNPEIEEVISKNASLLSLVSKGRINHEMERLLHEDPTILETLDRNGLLQYACPAAYDIKSRNQEAYGKTLKTIRYLAQSFQSDKDDLYLATLSILFHDAVREIEKAQLPPSEIDKTALSGTARIALNDYLNDTIFEPDKRKIVKTLVFFHDMEVQNTKGFYNDIIKGRHQNSRARFFLMKAIRAAVLKAEDCPKKEINRQMAIYDTMIAKIKPIPFSFLSINGNDIEKALNLQSSEQIGTIKAELYQAIIDGLVSNKKAKLIQYLKKNYLPKS